VAVAAAARSPRGPGAASRRGWGDRDRHGALELVLERMVEVRGQARVVVGDERLAGLEHPAGGALAGRDVGALPAVGDAEAGGADRARLPLPR